MNPIFGGALELKENTCVIMASLDEKCSEELCFVSPILLNPFPYFYRTLLGLWDENFGMENSRLALPAGHHHHASHKFAQQEEIPSRTNPGFPSVFNVAIIPPSAEYN